MHIHKHDVCLNSEDIVDDFAASGSRRMGFLFLVVWYFSLVPFDWKGAVSGTVSGIKCDKNALPCFPVVLLVSA